jgi:hypothetical protein
MAMRQARCIFGELMSLPMTVTLAHSVCGVSHRRMESGG